MSINVQEEIALMNLRDEAWKNSNCANWYEGDRTKRLDVQSAFSAGFFACADALRKRAQEAPR